MSIALITGSCGLVGSDSATFLSKKGFQVVGIDNNTRKFFFGKDGDISWIRKKLKTDLKNYTHFNYIFIFYQPYTCRRGRSATTSNFRSNSSHYERY